MLEIYFCLIYAHWRWSLNKNIYDEIMTSSYSFTRWILYKKQPAEFRGLVYSSQNACFEVEPLLAPPVFSTKTHFCLIYAHWRRNLNKNIYEEVYFLDCCQNVMLSHFFREVHLTEGPSDRVTWFHLKYIFAEKNDQISWISSYVCYPRKIEDRDSVRKS